MKNLIYSFAAALTLGLAPFNPEPHIIGKVRWIAGGASGMTSMDYFDFILHGTPWLFFFYFMIKFIWANLKSKFSS